MSLTFSRQLFSARNFRIKSFMNVPSVFVQNKNNLVMMAYPVLLFTYNPPSSMNQEFNKSMMFKMNPRNQKNVTSFFQKILDWFENPKYNDLYILDEHENKLMINMDYRGLQARTGSGSRYDPQAMLAQPAVITDDSIQSEGCTLTINMTQYTCALINSDIESIVGILETFTFQTEAQLLMMMASHHEIYTTKQPQITTSTPNTGPRKRIEW